jgi:hypothetical protein
VPNAKVKISLNWARVSVKNNVIIVKIASIVSLENSLFMG